MSQCCLPDTLLIQESSENSLTQAQIFYIIYNSVKRLHQLHFLTYCSTSLCFLRFANCISHSANLHLHYYLSVVFFKFHSQNSQQSKQSSAVLTIQVETQQLSDRYHQFMYKLFVSKSVPQTQVINIDNCIADCPPTYNS